MRNTKRRLATATAIALIAGVAAPAVALRLDDFEVFIEINDTDGDAGIQMMLDAEGWDAMQCTGPGGVVLLDVLGSAGVGLQGITEFAFESAEPSFDEQPLEEFLELFPVGKYKCNGTTTDGTRLRGKTRLTHALPDAPQLLFPVDEEVDPDDAEFVWTPVGDPPGSEIVGYHVVVECEEPELQAFTADVGPGIDRITVPPEYLDQGGEECKWEVLAIEDSGNRTISEAEFEIE